MFSQNGVTKEMCSFPFNYKQPCCFFASLVFLFSFAFTFPPESLAQSQPACQFEASDIDGDGTGREFNVDTAAFGDCQVNELSTLMPNFFNQQTGTEVILQRAYWDPNADLANRTLQCDPFIFNENTGQYEEGSQGVIPFQPVRDAPFSVFHYPLPTEEPHIGTALGFIETKLDRYTPMWSVDNGVYNGPAPMARSHYVEIVDHNGGTENAIRVWGVGLTDYYLCYDPDGGVVRPTGAPGEFTATPDAEPQERVVTMLQRPVVEFQQAPPPYTNLETGLEVQLVEPRWNYHADLALRRISCNKYRWNGDTYVHDATSERDIDYVFQPLRGDSALVTKSVIDTGIVMLQNEEFSIIDGELQFSDFGRAELLDQAVRFWADDFSYDQCTSVKLLGVIEPLNFVFRFPNEFRNDFFEALGYTSDDPVDFGPTGNIIAGSCDYSEAALNDGWGWNAEASESCAPRECDYTAAADNNGWGWDPVAQQSCPPITEPDMDQADCDYSNASNNNGWGWNPVTLLSCAPIESDNSFDDGNCDYTYANVNDGWGWDRVAMRSCAP